MQNKLRQFLILLLGVRKYLSLVSKVFILMTLAGLFKSKYPEYQFVRRYLQKGWVCIDIGANLGYFSIVMSRSVGNNGVVHAVEPIKLFNHIFRSNIQWFGNSNIKLHSFALGAENSIVTMGTPEKEGIFRHGLTRISDKDEQNFARTYLVDVKVPDEAFGHLKRLDYIKCDIEGYEDQVIPYFMNVIDKYKPLLQIEIATQEKRKQIWELLKPLSYKVYGLQGSELQELNEDQMLAWEGSDLFFINENRKE